MDLLTSIEFLEEIDVKDPKGLRDLMKNLVEETHLGRVKILLASLYSQLKIVIRSAERGDVDDETLRRFFQETVRVIFFEEGCEKLNLYEYATSLFNDSPNWYAMMACFLSEECRKKASLICYPLLEETKATSSERISNLFKAFNLLYTIQDDIPSECEYRSGLPRKEDLQSVPPMDSDDEEKSPRKSPRKKSPRKKSKRIKRSHQPILGRRRKSYK